MDHRRNPTPANTKRVQTIEPKLSGFLVPQEPAQPVAIETPGGPVGGSPDNWPKAKYADWKLIDGVGIRRGSPPRRFDAYALSLLARAGKKDPLPLSQEIGQVFGNFTYRLVTSQPGNVTTYCLFKFSDVTVVVFPDMPNYDQIIAPTKPYMAQITGLNPNWYFFNDFRDDFTNLYTAIDTELSPLLTQRSGVYLFIGHGLGGTVANWIAYKLNQVYTPQSWEQGLIDAVYSFGAPAGWASKSAADYFTPQHSHFNLISAQDAMPGITQVWQINTEKGSSANPDAAPIPVAHATYEKVIGQPDEILKRLEKWADDFAKNVWKGTNPLELAAQMDAVHRLTNYNLALEEQCRVSGDMPLNVFTAATALYTALNAQGF